MIPAGVLLYRDDTGRTVAEKLAQRALLPNQAGVGDVRRHVPDSQRRYLCACTGDHSPAIRASGAATSVACPYPFPEAKVYDPQAYYEKAGQPGPYFGGIMSGWESAQPNGRPSTSLNAANRCSGSNG